jgi:hypothetical protein
MPEADRRGDDHDVAVGAVIHQPIAQQGKELALFAGRTEQRRGGAVALAAEEIHNRAAMARCDARLGRPPRRTGHLDLARIGDEATGFAIAAAEVLVGFVAEHHVTNERQRPGVARIAVDAEQVAAAGGQREPEKGQNPAQSGTGYSAALATGFINAGGAYFRSCCSDGTILRASSTLARSISAIVNPVFSPPASASTSPHGATATEWP